MKLAAALPSSLLNGYNPLGLRKSPRWCGCLRFAVSLQQAVELCHRALVAGSLSACTQFVHSRAALCRTIAGCVSLIKILFDVHLGPHRGGMHLRWATLVPLPHYNFVGRISSNIEVGAESINFAAHFHYQPTFLSSYSAASHYQQCGSDMPFLGHGHFRCNLEHCSPYSFTRGMKPQLLAGFPAGGLYPKESIARVGDEAAMRAPFLCLAVDIAECQLRNVSCSRRSLAAGV